MGCARPIAPVSTRLSRLAGRFRAALGRWPRRRHRPVGTAAMVAAVATAMALLPHSADASPQSTARVGSAQSVAAFKAWARSQVGARQFAALNRIWTHESGWNRYARNPSSGAYGIPQALPARKLRHAGRDWSWNGYTQMRWGLHYIRSHYGSATRAWHFWNLHHWY